MKHTNLQITLCHLYPELLNIYGDIGNVITLQKRALDRNIEFIVKQVNLGDEMIDADIYFMGGGQDRQQVEVSMELQKHKDFLVKKRNENKVFLGICGGYQLFGEYFNNANGEKILGIGLLNAYTLSGKKRFIGNVTAKTDFLEPKTIVGFENHLGRTFLTYDTKPLATVTIGNGNNGETLTEGARLMNVFGTYFHGSFLPKNPHFADYLLELALKNIYSEDVNLTKLDDKIEWQTHLGLVNKPY